MVDLDLDELRKIISTNFFFFFKGMLVLNDLKYLKVIFDNFPCKLKNLRFYYILDLK